MPLRMQYLNLTMLDELRESNSNNHLILINSHTDILEFHAVNLIQNLLTVAVADYIKTNWG